MYRLQILYKGKVVLSRSFKFQKDVIKFTGHLITYNDFKSRKHPKKYRTKKDFFRIEKI